MNLLKEGYLHVEVGRGKNKCFVWNRQPRIRDIVIAGLLSNKTPKLLVEKVEGKGRGVLAGQAIKDMIVYSVLRDRKVVSFFANTPTVHKASNANLRRQYASSKNNEEVFLLMLLLQREQKGNQPKAHSGL